MNLCVYVRLFAHVQMKRRVQWMCVRMMSVCACFIHMRDSRRRHHHRCHRSRSTLCYGPKCEWISQKQNKSVNYFKRILIIFWEIFELWIVNGFGYNGAVYASWMWILCVCVLRCDRTDTHVKTTANTKMKTKRWATTAAAQKQQANE